MAAAAAALAAVLSHAVDVGDVGVGGPAAVGGGRELERLVQPGTKSYNEIKIQ